MSLAKRHSILGSWSALTGPGILLQPYVLVGASAVPGRVSVPCLSS